MEKNHGVCIYPGLCNTSDYKQTNESFDTIPLQTKRLNDAVTSRFNELGKPNLRLSPDQRYICKRMGSQLPLLPFSGDKEFKAYYAKIVNESDYPNDDNEAAIKWCKVVDGINILPKLPSHIRIHRARWDHNQRVRECVEKTSATNACLEELNEKIKPRTQSKHTGKMNTMPQSSEAARSLLSTSIFLRYPARCNTVMPGCLFPTPSPDAFVHSDSRAGMTVAGISIGASSLHIPTDEVQTVTMKTGRPKGRVDICERGGLARVHYANNTRLYLPMNGRICGPAKVEWVERLVDEKLVNISRAVRWAKEECNTMIDSRIISHILYDISLT